MFKYVYFKLTIEGLHLRGYDTCTIFKVTFIQGDSVCVHVGGWVGTVQGPGISDR